MTATTPAMREALRLPVMGINLHPGTLADQFATTPTLLVFLRHAG